MMNKKNNGFQKDKKLTNDAEAEASLPKSECDISENQVDLSDEGQEEVSGEVEKTALEQEVEELRAQLEKKKEELLRKQADFDNFRRISRGQQEEAREYALNKFLEKLLSVVDNLERAMEAARNEDLPSSYLDGLEMIQKQFLQLLEAEGVTVMTTMGELFDPKYHHAVLQGEQGDGEPGTVVDELQKGYIYKKRVLRPAMVKVC